MDLLRIEKHALRRVKISEILKEVHRRQNLRLFTVCVFDFSYSGQFVMQNAPFIGETLFGAGGIRKKFGPFEMKSINWAVVQRLPSVMPMSMHWALVLMSLRMQHLAGVVSWTRCPYRCLVTFSRLLFPEQFTVGVLNATLDLAALVLVGVVGFLGSEVVLSPVVSHCLRLSPFMWGVGGGWCGRFLGL